MTTTRKNEAVVAYGGLRYTADAFKILYRSTLRELKGTFELRELALIIDAFKDTLLTAFVAGQRLDAQVIADAIALDGLGEKWHVDGPALNGKIAALPVFARACLEIWATEFWRQKNKEQLDFEAWAKQLAPCSMTAP